MEPRGHPNGRATLRARIGVLAGTALAASVYLAASNTAVGHASAPNAALPSDVTASLDPAASPTAATTSATGNPISTTVTASLIPSPTATIPETTTVASATQQQGGPQRHATVQRSTAQADSPSDSAGQDLVLTADSLDAVGLTYVDTFTVSLPAGSVEVLRFTMTSASVDRMSVTQACASGVATATTAGSALLGQTTFDASSLDATVHGAPVSFTVADPPSQPFPSELVLQDLALAATTVSAETLSMATLRTQEGSC